MRDDTVSSGGGGGSEGGALNRVEPWKGLGHQGGGKSTPIREKTAQR